MGMTRLDVVQLGTMYGCKDSVVDFHLCSNDKDKCTTEDCVCHQEPGEDEPKIKVFNSDCGGYQCVSKCPNVDWATSAHCGCPEGCKKKTWASGSSSCEDCKPTEDDDIKEGGGDHPGDGEEGSPAPTETPTEEMPDDGDGEEDGDHDDGDDDEDAADDESEEETEEDDDQHD